MRSPGAPPPPIERIYADERAVVRRLEAIRGTTGKRPSVMVLARRPDLVIRTRYRRASHIWNFAEAADLWIEAARRWVAWLDLHDITGEADGKECPRRVAPHGRCDHAGIHRGCVCRDWTPGAWLDHPAMYRSPHGPIFVAQPYISAPIGPLRSWAESAGLMCEMSTRHSWHYPNATLLITVRRPRPGERAPGVTGPTLGATPEPAPSG